MPGRIMNVIKETEMDQLSTPWVVARVSCLLGQCGTMAVDLGVAGDGPTEQGAMASELPVSQDLDKPIYMKENVRLGLFQIQTLECRVKPLIGESAQVMVTLLRAGAAQPGGCSHCSLGYMFYIHTLGSSVCGSQ